MAIDAVTQTSARGKNQQAFQLFLTRVPQPTWDALPQHIKDGIARFFDERLNDFGQVPVNDIAASNATLDGWIGTAVSEIPLVGIPAKLTWQEVPFAIKSVLFDAVRFVIKTLASFIGSMVMLGGGAVVVGGIGVLAIGGFILIVILSGKGR